MGSYRILFEIVDKSSHLVWQEVEIQVCADDVIDAAAQAREIARRNYGQRAEAVRVTYFSPAVQPDAAVKAGEIARHDYGDTVKPTGIITYFQPREPGRAERQAPKGNLDIYESQTLLGRREQDVARRVVGGKTRRFSGGRPGRCAASGC